MLLRRWAGPISLSRRSLDRITKRSHDERFCPDRIFECLDLYEATGTPFARDRIRSDEELEWMIGNGIKVGDCDKRKFKKRG